MGINNHAQRNTGSKYMDVDNPFTFLNFNFILKTNLITVADNYPEILM